MILGADGRPAQVEAAVTLETPALADVAALCFLLNAQVHGADCGVSYSRVVLGDPVHGSYICVRASRHGVQKRVA